MHLLAYVWWTVRGHCQSSRRIKMLMIHDYLMIDDDCKMNLPSPPSMLSRPLRAMCSAADWAPRTTRCVALKNKAHIYMLVQKRLTFAFTMQNNVHKLEKWHYLQSFANIWASLKALLAPKSSIMLRQSSTATQPKQYFAQNKKPKRQKAHSSAPAGIWNLIHNYNILRLD